MSTNIILQGVSVDELTAHITAAVMAELRPALTESTGPMLVDGDRMAELLGVSRPHVDRLRAAGTIPSVMIGRRRLYRPDAVIDALEKATNEKGGAENA